MTKPRRGQGRKPPPASPPEPMRRCRSCERELRAASAIGWECDCGVAVCAEETCFQECFKRVAGGEATRCLSCGAVT